jgi:hypothetical protein
MSLSLSMKVVSFLLAAKLMLFFVCTTFLLSSRMTLAEDDNDKEHPDQSLGKIKQTIEQDEDCEDSSVCKQAAENNLILCPVGSTCVFMTNDFVPFSITVPR